MTNEDRIKTFAKILFSESEQYKHPCERRIAKEALTAFAVDIGIVDERQTFKEFSKDYVYSMSLETLEKEDIIGRITIFEDLSEDELVKLLTSVNYNSTPHVYSSDKEAFVRNLARISFATNIHNYRIMLQAIGRLALELGIITRYIYENMGELRTGSLYNYSNTVRYIREAVEAMEQGRYSCSSRKYIVRDGHIMKNE